MKPTDNPRKRTVPKDAKDYHVVQIAPDTSTEQARMLERGKLIGGKRISFKDGVLRVQDAEDSFNSSDSES